MDELNPTVREQEIYEEMELTPEMIKSIRTLCATCLRHFVEAKAFKIAIVPSADNSMDTCTVCQTRRGYDYVVMHRLYRCFISVIEGDDVYRIKRIAPILQQKPAA